MTDLENLKQTSFHDMGINSLLVDFEHRLLTITLGVYNEDTRGYDDLKLEFLGISNLNLGPLELDGMGFDDLEVYSHTVTQAVDNHAIHFVLLTGFSRPSAEWSFTFEQVKLS